MRSNHKYFFKELFNGILTLNKFLIRRSHSVATLLLTIVFLSVVLLVLTPWLKTGILLTSGSLLGYLYFAGVDSWVPVILLILGIILIVLEIFIPDFGILGILGIGTLGLGLYFTTGDISKTITDISIALIVSVVLVIILVRSGYSFANWNRFVLNTQSSSKNKPDQSEEHTDVTVGMIGKAVTPLRPSGKVVFEGSPLSYDVLSSEGHIADGTPVVIQEVHGTKILVRKK